MKAIKIVTRVPKKICNFHTTVENLSLKDIWFAVVENYANINRTVIEAYSHTSKLQVATHQDSMWKTLPTMHRLFPDGEYSIKWADQKKLGNKLTELYNKNKRHTNIETKTDSFISPNIRNLVDQCNKNKKNTLEHEQGVHFNAEFEGQTHNFLIRHVYNYLYLYRLTSNPSPIQAIRQVTVNAFNLQDPKLARATIVADCNQNKVWTWGQAMYEFFNLQENILKTTKDPLQVDLLKRKYKSNIIYKIKNYA